jgi:hypothetical protein
MIRMSTRNLGVAAAAARRQACKNRRQRRYALSE